MKNFKSFLLVVALLPLFSFAQEELVLKGKELFGDMRARQIGPAIMSGRISDIAQHPSNNQIIYIGTAGGGVWKSGDGGASFSSMFDKHNQSIGCITVDPNNPDNEEMDDLTRAQLSEFVANFMEGANDAEATYRKHYCQMVVNKIHSEFGYEGLCELMITMDKRAGWISDILIESPDLDEILFKKYNIYDDDIASKARDTVAMQDLNGKIWRLRRKYSRLIVDELMANAKPKA
jgi:hypothetical protein